MEYLIPGKKRRDGKRSPYRGRFRLSPDEKIREVPLHTTDKQIAWKRLRESSRKKRTNERDLFGQREEREAMQRPLLGACRKLYRGAVRDRPGRKVCARIEEKAVSVGDRSSLETYRGHNARNFLFVATKTEEVTKDSQ